MENKKKLTPPVELHPNMSEKQRADLEWQNKMNQLSSEMHQREQMEYLNQDIVQSAEVENQEIADAWKRVADQEGVDLDEFDREHGIDDDIQMNM